jgi:hypothetical protein
MQATRTAEEGTPYLDREKTAGQEPVAVVVQVAVTGHLVAAASRRDPLAERRTS